LDKLFGALFVLVGTAFFVYTLVQIWRAYRSLKWPIVEAEVLDTSIKEHRGRGRSYEPVVRYRFEFEGKAYESNRLVFSATSVTGSREDAEELLKQLHVGARIPVRVCPAKSQLCVVQPGFERAWWIPLAFSVAFILGGLSLWNKP
jgi:uncharacterized protein DUF3592